MRTGTLEVSLSDTDYHVFRKGVSEKFEDGTIPFLNILSLKYGLEIFEQLGVENIDAYVLLLLFISSNTISQTHICIDTLPLSTIGCLETRKWLQSLHYLWQSLAKRYPETSQCGDSSRASFPSSLLILNVKKGTNSFLQSETKKRAVCGLQ